MILFSKCPKTMSFSKRNSRFSGAFWELKAEFFPLSFFSPQLNLRKKNLFLSEKSFPIFFYFRGKKKKILPRLSVSLSSEEVSPRSE